MSRPRSFFAPLRRSLLEAADDPPIAAGSIDPFQPLGNAGPRARRRRSPLADPLALAASVGPAGRNRAGDVRRVETVLGRTGFLDPLDKPSVSRPRPGGFDPRLDQGVRRFQSRNGLKVDGLLNPAGPTVRALNRVLAASTPKPRTGRTAAPLAGLTSAAFSANTRLIRHLLGTREDGLVPSLMADDFRLGTEGRAKTADFLGQLFKRDPERARSLRAKAGAFLGLDERRRLDRLILAARLADEDEEEPEEPEPEKPEPEDPEPEDPKPEDPKPEKPKPEDPKPENPKPENPKPEKPEPEKPKPDKEKCDRLKVELANAEQAAKEAAERMRKAAAAYNKQSREVEARWQEFKRQAVAFGIGNIGNIIDLKKGRMPRGLTLPSEVLEAWQAYSMAVDEAEKALEEQKAAQADLDEREAEAQAIREQMKENGCG